MINALIVEDDPMVAELNRRYMEKVDGYRLIGIANSVDEALEFLKQKKIHLILLDIYMPHVYGWELLSKIRKAEEEIDIIVISAASDNESIKKALRFGVVDYLIKPFEFDRLHSALENYKSGHSAILNKNMFKQADIDSQFFYRQGESDPIQEELPKGLTRNTLKLVWEQTREMERSPFTAEELAEKVGISRVSIRKYLNFLIELEMIKANAVYGMIGRPLYKYQRTNKSAETLKEYL